MACAPTDPTMWSRLGAIASSARPIRSSFSAAGWIPKTSSTAHALAHSSTRHSEVGEVNRLATSASITCPWVSVATDRAGPVHDPGKVTALAEVGHHRQRPSSFSTLAGP
jgi:hypothetical protein